MAVPWKSACFMTIKWRRVFGEQAIVEFYTATPAMLLPKEQNG